MEMTSLSSIITMEIDGGTMRDPASIIENQVEDSVRDAPEHLAGGVAQAAGTQPGAAPEEEVVPAGGVAQAAAEDRVAEDRVAEDRVAEEGGRAVWNLTGQRPQSSEDPKYWKNGSKPTKMFN